ncbi:MAG: SDR family NAD(P)-dependent oxidoreductase [Ilumatobacteraceae bacterium]
MSTSFDFSGRTVVVTGGARGIGLALSRFFAAAGATVAVVDVNEQSLADVLTGDLDGAIPLVADVSDSASVNTAVQHVLDTTGRIDVVVNNAGILRDRMVWKLTDDDWQAVLGVHLTGTFNLTRAVVPTMRQRGYGRIVNVTSYTGLHGNIGQANYAAAKAGIIGFTRTTAKELAGFGITVNAISPNAETDMVASIPEERLVELRAEIPMGRFSAPEEACPVVGFLASEQAGYITGVVVPVDGGLSI